MPAWLVQFVPAGGQVVPIGIHALDEFDFPATNPAFKLLLSFDCGIGIEEGFVVDEPSKVVAARKTGNQFVFVLEDALDQVSGDANIENVMPRPVGHDVHAEAFGIAHGGSVALHAGSVRSACKAATLRMTQSVAGSL